MLDLTARRWRTALIAAAASAALGVGAIAVGPGASGVPTADINQVRNQVRDLQGKAEAAHERYERAAHELAGVQATLDGLRRKLQRERDELTVVMSAVEDLARSTYTSGGLDPSLQVLMAEDPSEFLAQAAVLDQVAQAQAASLRQTQTARVRLAQSEAAVQDKEAIAQSFRNDMADAQQEVDDQLAEAQRVLATLQEEERRRLAALQAADRSEGLAAAQAYLSGSIVAPNSRAQAAVSYALSQVGDPYSYSANPPSSWDCSKLTTAAWAQAGVGLTPLSYIQWNQVQRIPSSEVQPGDLVFYFGLGAHHVGLYIGNGQMVHAANPSDGVRIDNIFGPWYAERFSGIGRVI
ncbi:MAG: NlpC/P60 family protein [Actinomycetota bacterium]|nr:NlpC/P60 family protein [Actinomycetota bacterium]